MTAFHDTPRLFSILMAGAAAVALSGTVTLAQDKGMAETETRTTAGQPGAEPAESAGTTTAGGTAAAGDDDPVIEDPSLTNRLGAAPDEGSIEVDPEEAAAIAAARGQTADGAQTAETGAGPDTDEARQQDPSAILPGDGDMTPQATARDRSAGETGQQATGQAAVQDQIRRLQETGQLPPGVVVIVPQEHMAAMQERMQERQAQMPTGQMGQDQGQMPMGRMQMDQGQMPMGRDQMQMGQGQMPMDRDQMPMGQRQMGEGQMPMGQGQMAQRPQQMEPGQYRQFRRQQMSEFDENYSRWRANQIAEMDRAYQEWRENVMERLDQAYLEQRRGQMGQQQQQLGQTPQGGIDGPDIIFRDQQTGELIDPDTVYITPGGRVIVDAMPHVPGIQTD